MRQSALDVGRWLDRAIVDVAGRVGPDAILVDVGRVSIDGSAEGLWFVRFDLPLRNKRGKVVPGRTDTIGASDPTLEGAIQLAVKRAACYRTGCLPSAVALREDGS